MVSADFDTKSLFSVDGLVAVITGGGTGIGLMMASALENNGATVYIVGRRLDVLEKAAKENNKYCRIIPLQCDVTSRESLLSVVEIVKARHGYVNLLINNSGVVYNMLPVRAPEDDISSFQAKLWNAGTAAQFTQTFDVNVSAVYYCTVAFLALLDAGNKRGPRRHITSQVITVSSVAAFRRDEQTFSLSYGASKAAATHLGKSLCNLLKDWDIRSNIIAPGIYPSEMTAGILPKEVSADIVPLRRLGDADDIGGLVLFLASKAGAYVNGTVNLTDGGRLALFPSTY